MPNYKTIDAGELKKRLDDDKTVVINVLGEDSYEEQHIPGTRNIPESGSDFGDRVRDAVPDRERPIVVYCASETCAASPRAATKLVEMGYENVFDFEDGMKGWQEAGMELEGEAAPTPSN